MQTMKRTSVAFFLLLVSLVVWGVAPAALAETEPCVVLSDEFDGTVSAGPYTLPEGERIAIRVTNYGDKDVIFNVVLEASNLPVPIPSGGIINPDETESLSLRATEDITVSATVTVTGPVSWVVYLGDCEVPSPPLDDRLVGTSVDVAVYYNEDSGEGLSIYAIDDSGEGSLVIRITPEELAEWDAMTVTQNTLIAQNADGTIGYIVGCGWVFPTQWRLQVVGSVLRHGGINFVCPGQNAPGNIPHLRRIIARFLQKEDAIRAALPTAAQNIQRLILGDFRQYRFFKELTTSFQRIFRRLNFALGNPQRVIKRRNCPLMRIAHI